MNVEDVFSSKLRIRLLKLLAQIGELNVSEIARRLNVNFETVNKHLAVLENEGILKHKVFGRIRLYRFNEQSPKTRAILSLIEIWEKTG